MSILIKTRTKHITVVVVIKIKWKQKLDYKRKKRIMVAGLGVCGATGAKKSRLR